jgi:transcription elongation factor GreA
VTDTANVTYLSQDAYDRLKDELEQLSGPGREDIARRIEEARSEGDLKENGGYHAAKEEQGKQEGRIRQLTQLLRDAVVGEAPVSGGKAAPGTVVTVRYADGDTERFLVGSREADPEGLEVYSPQSPLGGAVLGHAKGEKVTYSTPNGRSIVIEVVDVEPFTG